MSNSHLFMKAGFPIPPLKNGVGRYVCQLKRITLKFCKTNGGSKGIRQFIEADLIDFARANPGTVVYIKPRRFRTACLSAEYLNGETETVGCNKMTREEISKWLNWLKTRSGLPEMRLMKMWHTDNPSIQGVWSPFTHRDPSLNITTFPRVKTTFPLESWVRTETEHITTGAVSLALYFSRCTKTKENFSGPGNRPQSATEILIEMFKKQKLEEEQTNSTTDNTEVK